MKFLSLKVALKGPAALQCNVSGVTGICRSTTELDPALPIPTVPSFSTLLTRGTDSTERSLKELVYRSLLTGLFPELLNKLVSFMLLLVGLFTRALGLIWSHCSQGQPG